MSRRISSRAPPSVIAGGSSWRKLAATSQPSPAQLPSNNSISSVAEDDGFKPVQHRKPSNAKSNTYSSKQPLTATSNNSRLPPSQAIPIPKPRIGLYPGWQSNASVAAAARSTIYQPRVRVRAGSIYKESCMPISERDQALMAAQNSRGAKIPKALYRPGMLIRAAMHETDLNQGGPASSNVTVADRYRSDTKFGPIHTKVRKAIVIALYQDHYLAVPLFTHNGNGLLKKLSPDEFVSVRDHRNKGDFHKLSKHAALVTEHLNAGIDSLHKKSTAHITYLIARKYDLSVVHEGHLEAASTKHLVQLFNEYAPRAAKL